MPQLSQKDIEKLVSGGKIKLITLDTNILKRYNYGLEHGLLARMQQFQASDVNVVMSEIIIKEMSGHMEADIDDAQKAIEKAIKKVGASRNISVAERKACLDAFIGNDTAEQCVAKRIRRFMVETGCAEVPCDGHVDINRVVSSYFGKVAPFENSEAKKNEFPDALALQSLESYAKAKGTMCIVVSKDGGWKCFCETSDWLICEAELADAISHFQNVPSVVAANFAQQIGDGIPEVLSEAIEHELKHVVENMGWFAEASAGHFYEQEPDEIKFLEFAFKIPVKLLVVGRDEEEDRIDFQATLEVDVEAGCGFTFFIPDEGVQFPFGSAYTTATDTLNFEIAFSVYGETEGDFDVEDIEVLDHDTTINFGEVEPDFSDPEDY